MKIKLLLLVFAIVFTTANLLASDFTVDGIAYNVTSSISPYTVKVSKKSPVYTGAVTIPASVSYNSINYSVTSIGYEAFQQCTGLTSVTIPNSVTSIEYYAFYNCYRLASLTIPNSVTSIGNYAFDYCTGLTSVSIPSSVTSIGNSTFYKCTGLISITIPNSVTSIGNSAFAYCTGLIFVIIPNSVTSIEDQAFFNCTGLTAVTIPSSVTSIQIGAFANCTGLTSIYADSPTPVDLSSSSGVFYDVNKTKCTLYVPIGSKSLYKTAYQWEEFTNIEESSTGSFTVGGIAYFITSSTSTKTVEVAYGGAYTDAVSIPASVSYNSISYSVNSIGNYAFYQCVGLSSVTIPGSVISIGSYAFYGCKGLTSITIPSSVTSIGKYAFTLNSCLFYVDGNNSNFSSKDDVLYNKNQTTLIQCPVSKSGSFVIPSSVTSIADGAFESCSGLTSVIIPNSVTFIGDHAFESCTCLTSVAIPNSVTSIGNYAFYKCTGLTSVTITASVVTLPNSVTFIGDYAFDKCTGLISLYANSSIPINLILNSDASYTGFNAAITLYVPTGSKSLYAAAPVWKDFKNIVEHVVTGLPTVSVSRLNIRVMGRMVEIGLPEATAHVQVVDISGRQLYKGTPSGSTLSVTLPQAGIYLVRIGNKTAKLVAP